jgi:hypothetical protein
VDEDKVIGLVGIAGVDLEEVNVFGIDEVVPTPVRVRPESLLATEV